LYCFEANKLLSTVRGLQEGCKWVAEEEGCRCDGAGRLQEDSRIVAGGLPEDCWRVAEMLPEDCWRVAGEEGTRRAAGGLLNGSRRVKNSKNIMEKKF